MNLSFLEQFAINIILGILTQTIKNPAKKAELKSILLGLADNIYVDYGLVPVTRNEAEVKP